MSCGQGGEAWWSAQVDVTGGDVGHEVEQGVVVQGVGAGAGADQGVEAEAAAVCDVGQFVVEDEVFGGAGAVEQDHVAAAAGQGFIEGAYRGDAGAGGDQQGAAASAGVAACGGERAVGAFEPDAGAGAQVAQGAAVVA